MQEEVTFSFYVIVQFSSNSMFSGQNDCLSRQGPPRLWRRQWQQRQWQVRRQQWRILFWQSIFRRLLFRWLSGQQLIWRLPKQVLLSVVTLQVPHKCPRNHSQLKEAAVRATCFLFMFYLLFIYYHDHLKGRQKH